MGEGDEEGRVAMNNLFIPLNVTSKYAICGLPLRVDTYKTCSFGCKYCFANYRKVMNFNETLKLGDVGWVRNKLKKVFDYCHYNKESFLDQLIVDGITWHCGGMSDPFQVAEKEYNVTADLVDVTNEYDIDILFSTKSDKTYNADINPNNHSFQLSVTNIDDRKDIEPNVPPIKDRLAFFNKLKDEGYKVGIRLQPFIPGITDERIVDMFREADYVTIEGLKLVPQDMEHRKEMLKLTGMKEEDFVQMGLLNMKPEIRMELYKGVRARLEEYGIPYSLADNDFHNFSSSKCCCGGPLVKKSTNFNNTAMYFKNTTYTLQDVENELGPYKGCKASHLVASNRVEGCKTVMDFYKKRFRRKSSPFSRRFLYIDPEQSFLEQYNQGG